VHDKIWNDEELKAKEKKQEKKEKLITCFNKSSDLSERKKKKPFIWAELP